MPEPLFSLVQPLTEAEADRLLTALWPLLAERAGRYTLGDSTSVPLETAQELLFSICFTLESEMALSGSSPRTLLETGVTTVFRQGQARLLEKTAEVRSLWAEAWTMTESLGNGPARAVLVDIQRFLRRYDPYFFAPRTLLDFGIILPGAAGDVAEDIFFIGDFLTDLSDFLAKKHHLPLQTQNHYAILELASSAPAEL